MICVNIKSRLLSLSIVAALCVAPLLNAQVTIPLDPSGPTEIDLSNGDISIKSLLSVQDVSTQIGVVPITGGINSFTGPGGCVNCTVQPNTSFSLDWDVANVAGCTGSNTRNHASFNGTVEPFGGGSGQFSKTISGGLPAGSGTTTFTLNCPTTQIKTYNFKYITKDVVEISVPSDKRILVANHGALLTLININIDKSLLKTSLEPSMKSLGHNMYFTQVATNNLEDLSLNLSYGKDAELPENVRTWLFLSDKDPRVDNSARPYDVGRCDSLIKSPTINLSTYSILKNNLLNTCSIEPDKKYYLTRIYLSL